MNNISSFCEDIYVPVKSIVLYETVSKRDAASYLECYDMDEEGRPINARPLTEEEAQQLAESLQVKHRHNNCFLQSESLLPEHVIYTDPFRSDGLAIWYTQAFKANLFFKKELGIPCGRANVPALLWRASRLHLEIFALVTSGRPTIKTQLFHAPFFNVYADGSVCMGTVDVEIGHNCSMQQFIKSWQQYFFNSYFTHTMENHAPVNINIIELWKNQIITGRKFPATVLKKHYRTMEHLLS